MTIIKWPSVSDAYKTIRSVSKIRMQFKRIKNLNESKKKKIKGQCISYGVNRDNGLFGIIE